MAAFPDHPRPALPSPRASTPTYTYAYGPGGQLTVATRAEGHGAVLTLRGELDIAVTAALGTRVDAALAEGDVCLVMDLQGLTFCDCSGLTALLRARRLATAQNGWVRLAAVQPRVARIIRLAGLASTLPCHLDIAAAFEGSILTAPAATGGPRSGPTDPPATRDDPARRRPSPPA